MTGRRRLLAISLVLILAGLFWSTVWRGMDRSVLSRAPILDESHYLRRGAALARDHGVPEAPFTMSPLYSYLVAATGSGRELDAHGLRQGAPPTGIRVLQAVLWLGTAALLLDVGRRLLGPRWGRLPPLLWLGYAPAAILAGQVLLELPLTFCALAALVLAAGGPRPQPATPGRALAVGVLIGAAGLLRGTALVLAVPAAVALVRGGGAGGNRRRGVPVLGALVLGVLLPVAPFTVLNSRLAGGVAPPSLNAGVNLYIGNGEGANGFFRAFAGFDVERDPSGAAYLSGKLGRPVAGALDADRAWRAEALADMRAEPARTSLLWLRKVRLHAAGVEIPQISSFDAWRRHVPALGFLPVPYALLAAGGLAGIWLSRRRGDLQPWWLAAGLLVAAQSLFFVVTRYRLVLVPILALGTAAALQELARRRGRALAAGILVAAAAAAAVAPWGLDRTRLLLAAGGLDNEAVRWEHAADAAAGSDPAQAAAALDEAARLYERSQALDAARPQPWRGLARVRWRQGRLDEAADVLKEGLIRTRPAAGLRDDLIRMLLQRDRAAEAVPYLDAALRERPDDPELLHNTAVALAGTGRTEQAVAAARRLTEVRPDDPRGYLDLGVMLGRAGRLEAAREAFAAGLARAPAHSDLARNLARVERMIANGAQDPSAPGVERGTNAKSGETRTEENRP